MTATQRLAPDLVEHANAPLVHIRIGSDGGVVGATAARLVRAPRERVWKVITDIDGMAGRVPMMQKVVRDGRFEEAHPAARFWRCGAGNPG